MSTRNSEADCAVNPYTRSADFKPPPRGIWATLRQLGPGMILVGGIVGSGELIMTTKLGAVAGFGLLWFVLLSCLIKVVVQAELTRHTISSGQTFLTVFNDLPGPAGPRPVWLTLPWMAAVLVASTVALAVYIQLPAAWRTGRVAGVFTGAVAATTILAGWMISLSRSKSLTKKVSKTFEAPAIISNHSLQQNSRHLFHPENNRPNVNWFTWLWLASMLIIFVNSAAILGGAGQTIEMALPGWFGNGGSVAWAVIIGAVAAALLLSGTYSVLEKTLITLVASFTLLTVISTILLQWTGFAVTWADLRYGVSMSLPAEMSTTVTLTALAMFAGTGVAYGEMWNYTYWCVEKGYARNIGESQPGTEWPRRARGWIRVMYTDVLLTMVFYTVSTVCFYILGCAILFAKQLDPDGLQTISVLSSAYTESLGSWAATLFVVGAFFVLFTTVLAGAAGMSRLMADVLGVIGIIDWKDYQARLRFIRIFVVVFLAMCGIAYWLFQNPPKMLTVTSTLIGALFYPIMGLGVLYLRHCKVDRRITPGKLTTVWLWICCISLTVISPGGILLALAIEYGWLPIHT